MSTHRVPPWDVIPDVDSLAKCDKCGNESLTTAEHHTLLDGTQIQWCSSCLDKWDAEHRDISQYVSIYRSIHGPRACVEMIRLIEGLQATLQVEEARNADLENRNNELACELAAIKAGPVVGPQVSVAAHSEEEELWTVSASSVSEEELGSQPATAASRAEELQQGPSTTNSSYNVPQALIGPPLVLPHHQCSGRNCWTCYPPIQGPLKECRTVGCTRHENRYGASYCAGYCCWFCMHGKKWQGQDWHGPKCQKWNGAYRSDWQTIMDPRFSARGCQCQDQRFSDHIAP